MQHSALAFRTSDPYLPFGKGKGRQPNKFLDFQPRNPATNMVPKRAAGPVPFDLDDRSPKRPRGKKKVTFRDFSTVIGERSPLILNDTDPDEPYRHRLEYMRQYENGADNQFYEPGAWADRTGDGLLNTSDPDEQPLTIVINRSSSHRPMYPHRFSPSPGPQESVLSVRSKSHMPGYQTPAQIRAVADTDDTTDAEWDMIDDLVVASMDQFPCPTCLQPHGTLSDCQDHVHAVHGGQLEYQEITPRQQGGNGGAGGGAGGSGGSLMDPGTVQAYHWTHWG